MICSVLIIDSINSGILITLSSYCYAYIVVFSEEVLLPLVSLVLLLLFVAAMSFLVLSLLDIAVADHWLVGVHMVIIVFFCYDD